MDRDLDLSLLRTFFTIAMTGSFTSAGRRLFRTQSAISLRMKRLEEMIGLPLITRSPDGVSLTPEGNLLLGYARRMLSLNDEVIRRIEREVRSEEVRIGLAEEYPLLDIEKALKAFTAEYPSASLTLDVQISRNLESRLQEGQFDMIVSASLDEPATGWIGKRTPTVWIASERLTLSKNEEIRLILPSKDNLYRRIALSALSETDVTWSIGCTSTSWTMTKSAVLAGAGISLVSLDMVECGMKLLDERNGLPPLPEIVISLLRWRSPSSAAIRRLAELLADSLLEIINL